MAKYEVTDTRRWTINRTRRKINPTDIGKWNVSIIKYIAKYIAETPIDFGIRKELLNEYRGIDDSNDSRNRDWIIKGAAVL
jgi:hypothetical protein